MKMVLKPLFAKVFAVLLISSLGIMVYSNTFHCQFHFDDFSFIVADPNIRNIHHLVDIWNRWPCRFLTFFSFALNYHFHHLDVVGYHVVNLAIHLMTAVLVSWLVFLTFSTPVMKEEKISRRAGLISLFAGLIFVAHPVQTQAVTFIWQRAASMAALFYMASVCFYVKAGLLQGNEPASKDSRSYYFLSLAAAVMAMFTKENVLTLPLMIFLYEVCFFKGQGSFHWKRIIPYLLILLIIPAILVLSGPEKAQARQSFLSNLSPVQYFLTELRVLLTYIRLAFIPVHQNLDYEYPYIKSLFEAPALLGLTFLSLVLIFAKLMFRKHRMVSFGILWFLLTLVPESSFFPFADVIFEHRLYLPLAGYSLFLASGLVDLSNAFNFKKAGLVLTVIVACYSVLTYQRNKIWKDELTLWSDTVSKSPHKARPHDLLGVCFAQRGDYRQAIAEYGKAVAILPEFAQAYYNRGVAYTRLGDFPMAISDYRKAIDLKPDFKEARHNLAMINSSIPFMDKRPVL